MRSEPTAAAISSELAEFIEFFDKALGDVRFPDVDRDKLAERADAVRDHAARVTRLGEELRAARDELDRVRAELDRTARRGLAYARVYAEGDERLSRQVAELAIARDSTVESKPKKRGRPRSKARDRDRAEKSAEKPTLPFTQKPADDPEQKPAGDPEPVGEAA